MKNPNSPDENFVLTRQQQESINVFSQVPLAPPPAPPPLPKRQGASAYGETISKQSSKEI